jgi:molybdate transport system substrate-binding protein
MKHTIVILWLLTAAAGPLYASADNEVMVFAAASLTDACNKIGALYRTRSGTAVRFSFAASSTLARQIEAGAGADILASADEEWMDYLERRHLVIGATRVSMLGNRLVLVAQAGSSLQVDMRGNFDLTRLLGNGRLATGDPAHVPVGRYAQQALQSLGVWKVAEPRLARADNVRAALALVERGEAPLGIVYATDAALASRVRIVGEFPPGSHRPIAYPFAIVTGHDRAEVKAFFGFLASGEARNVFRAEGFEVK